MYYNKKRMKTIALLGVVLLLGICGCGAETTVQEEQKQENVAGTVADVVVQEPAGKPVYIAQKAVSLLRFGR